MYISLLNQKKRDMKKQITVLALWLIGATAVPAQQSAAADELYRKYSTGEGVWAISLNHYMPDVLDMDFDFNDQMKNLSGDIHGLKFISFSKKAFPEKKLQRMARELKAAGLSAIPLPQDVKKEDLRFLQFYGEREAAHYKNIYMLLLSDDAETGLFIAVNGKLKIKKAS